MAKLVISLASRGRPQTLLDTIAVTLPNFRNPYTVLAVCIDDDDQPSIDAITPLHDAGKVTAIIAPREDSVGAKWNRALRIPADLYLHQSDHGTFRIPGFDESLLRAARIFPDGIGVVYGPLVNPSFSGGMAVTARFAELFDNQILPTYFPYWFADHWLDDIARITGRIAFTADASSDGGKLAGTQELREPSWWADWFDAAYLLRRFQAHKIICFMEEPAWRKCILYTHHPLVERRSRYVNDVVRAYSREWSVTSGCDLNDARYQRIRARAVDMIPILLAGMPEDEAKTWRDKLLPPTSVLNLVHG